MLKFLQARVQQYVDHELPDVQAGFRKGRGTRDQITNIRWIMEKAGILEKDLLLLYWLCQSLWQQTVENSERDGNTRPPDLPLENSVCRSRSKLELNMEQQTGSKLIKEYVKVVYWHPAYLTYIQSSVQSLSCVWLFMTPWISACQASLSITNSQFTQTPVHRVGDAIQPSHPLSSPSPPAPSPSQHQGLF